MENCEIVESRDSDPDELLNENVDTVLHVLKEFICSQEDRNSTSLRTRGAKSATDSVGVDPAVSSLCHSNDVRMVKFKENKP